MILTILIYITFFFFTFGQLGRLSFLDQQINFYFYEVWLFFSLIVLILKYRLQPVFHFYRQFKYLYWLIGFLFFSYFIYWSKISWWQNLTGLLYQLRFLSYFLYFIYLRYHLKKTKEFVVVLKKSVRYFILITIFSTAVQYWFYPDLRNLIYQGWDPHYLRAFGVFFDTAFSAGILSMIFFYLYFSKEKFLGLIYFIFIFLTFSRWVIISFIITFTIFLWQKKKLSWIIFLFFAVGVIIFLIPKPFGEGVNLTRVFSIKSRMVDYQNGFFLWKKNPLFGLGYNRLRYLKEGQVLSSHSAASFHSSFLVILVTGGIFGLVFFVLGLIELIKISQFSRWLIIFLSLASLADNILLYPFILFLLFNLILISSFRR